MFKADTTPVAEQAWFNMFKRNFFLEKGKEQKKQNSEKGKIPGSAPIFQRRPLKWQLMKKKQDPPGKSSDVTIGFSRDSKGLTPSKVGHKFGKLKDGS